MQKEETRFVSFVIKNRLLSEICKDFKIKVDDIVGNIASENNIGFEGRRGYCYVHSPISNHLGTPGELGLARWFADMILYTKIGNKKAADFIKTHADKIDRYTSIYEIEYEHTDPFSSESCLLMEKFYYKSSDKAQLCGFDERGWADIWNNKDLVHMETYMPQGSRYPLQLFVPKSEEEGHALGKLLVDGFGDQNGRSTDGFLRNVAAGTVVTEFKRPNYLQMQPIPYTPAPYLTSLEGILIYPFGEFKTVKKKDLKKRITAHQGKLAASYTNKVNIVLVGDDIGQSFDAGSDNFRSCENMERATARKWLGTDVIFVRESDLFEKNPHLR